MSEKATMSISRYAKEIGVSPAMVYKAIDDGHLKKSLEKSPNGYIRVNYAVAEREWVRTKKPSVPPEDDPAFAAGPSDPDDETENENVPLPEGVPHLHASKASREHWMAQQAQLDYEQALGKLIPRDEVRRRTFALARKTRDAMMAIPERVAAILAATKDEREVLDLLNREIASVCEDLAGMVEAPVVVAQRVDDGIDDI